jgi:pyrroloquinoline quinone biosynthesis protein D
LSVTADSIPALRRGVRRHFDAARNTPVLMAPERVVMLDDIAAAVLDQCDGKQNVAAIVAVLATRYAAPAAEVTKDVIDLLEELVAGMLVTI